MKQKAQNRSIAGRGLLVCLTLAGALFGAPAEAGEVVAKDWGPKHGVTFGGSAAWAHDSRGDIFAGGGELTYFHRMRAPVYGWISAGYRARSTGETSHLPYLETGATFFFLNLGLGIAQEIASGSRARFLLNGFVGLSVPVYFPTKERVLFLEPYYRPGTAVDFEGGVTHELGVMLKFFWAFAGD